VSLVIVVADSLRHDVAGCFGGAARTPLLDRLALSSVLFERAISAAPWTVPSVSAMLTGIYPHRLGLAKWEQPWPESHPSLFDLARGAGFEVGSFVFDQRHLFSRVPAAGVVGSSQDLEPMLSWLAAHRGERFVAFVHYWWTHIPYVDKPMSMPAWRAATVRVLEAMRSGAAAVDGVKQLYLRAVERFSERFLRQLTDSLDLDATWLVMLADHGEGFGERQEVAALTDVFDLHGNTLYDEVLRVPLVIRPPGGTEPRRVREIVRTVDLAPTTAELCGFGALPDAGADLDGVSLAKCVRDGASPPDLDALSVSNHDFVDLPELPRDPRELWNGFALSTERYKQIWYPAEDRRMVFDLQADPGETIDVADDCGDRLAPGWARLACELERATVGELDPDDVERVRRRLEGLGYLD